MLYAQDSPLPATSEAYSLRVDLGSLGDVLLQRLTFFVVNTSATKAIRFPTQKLESDRIRIIDTHIPEHMLAGNSNLVETCNDNAVCVFGSKRGTCGTAPILGVNCYGCSSMEKCRPLNVSILQRPDKFVAAGSQEIIAVTNDARCEAQVQINGGGVWRETLSKIGPLPIGIQFAAVRAFCPDNNVSSLSRNFSWEVVDGRPTNTSIAGPRLTNQRAPTFVLGSNKGGRCSFEYWLNDDGQRTTKDAKGSALEIKLLTQITSWPHSSMLIAFRSSMGIGTKFVIKIGDRNAVEATVADGEEAILQVEDLTKGNHAIEASAYSGGKTATLEATATVTSSIDTHLSGKALRNYAFFFLDSSGMSLDHYEVRMDNGDDWIVHHENVLQVGPLEDGEHEIWVRAVSTEGGMKDPIPAHYTWRVQTPAQVRITVAPIDTTSAFSLVDIRGNASSYRHAIDDAEPLDGVPRVIGPLEPGKHTLRVWAEGNDVPAVASWYQLDQPTFGKTSVEVNIHNEGWNSLYAVATDPLGNRDSKFAEQNFYADYSPPHAVVRGANRVQYENISAPEIACEDDFACDQRITVKIDSQIPFDTERDGFRTPPLSEGEHVIQLWAHDEAGNVQDVPTLWEIEIDRTPPPPPAIVVPFVPSRSAEIFIELQDVKHCVWELQRRSATDDGCSNIFQGGYNTVDSGSINKSSTFTITPSPATYRIWAVAEDKVGNRAEVHSTEFLILPPKTALTPLGKWSPRSSIVRPYNLPGNPPRPCCYRADMTSKCLPQLILAIVLTIFSALFKQKAQASYGEPPTPSI